MSREVSRSRSRGRVVRRRSLLGPMTMLSLLVLVVGWSALWTFARAEVGSAFGTWLDTERRNGRDWQCAGQSIAGFPFSITLRCEHLALRDSVGGTPINTDVAGVSAGVKLYFPTNVRVDVAGPLSVTDAAGAAIGTARWTDLHLTLRGALPGTLEWAALDGSGFAVLGSDSARPALARVGLVKAVATPNGGAAPTSMAIHFDATDATVPALDAVLGSTDPIAVSAQVDVAPLVIGSTSSLAEVLEPWRLAGGRLTIAQIGLTKGGFTAGGSGRLGLDEEHRVEGRLQARFTGLEPVAARLGIPLAAVKIGGALSSLLSMGKADPAPADLDLPLVFKDGRLSVGPVKTGVRLLPLY